jgi:hypothetical protein
MFWMVPDHRRQSKQLQFANSTEKIPSGENRAVLVMLFARANFFQRFLQYLFPTRLTA